MNLKRKTMLPKFFSDVSGYIEAEKWLHEIGMWEEVSKKKWIDDEGTDGWHVVQEANRIWNEKNIIP
jgi:hypothetical protein